MPNDRLRLTSHHYAWSASFLLATGQHSVGMSRFPARCSLLHTIGNFCTYMDGGVFLVLGKGKSIQSEALAWKGLQ